MDNIVIHPSHQSALIANEQVLEWRLIQQKHSASVSIEKAISLIKAMKTRDNARALDRTINELRLALDDSWDTDFLNASDPKELAEKLAYRVQLALTTFIIENCTAHLAIIGKIIKNQRDNKSIESDGVFI